MKQLAVFFGIISICCFVIICDEETTTDGSLDFVMDKDEIAFVKIGSYRGHTDDESEYQKTFFVSRYAIANWYDAKSICKSFDLELTSFETLNEANAFLKMSREHEFIKSSTYPFYLIDGMTTIPLSPTDWYWTNSGKKVSFSIPWMNGQPDFVGDLEYCLSIVPNEGFNDIFCVHHVTSFFCQRFDFFSQIRD